MKFNHFVNDCSEGPVAIASSWINDPDDPDLLNVCQAVPAYLPHQSMLDHLSDVIKQGQGATYTDIPGIPPLRAALADDINTRYQCNVSPTDTAITAGCNQGFCAVIDTLCESGDNVIAPLPCYFNHEMWLSMRGVNIHWLDFNEHSAQPDVAQAHKLIDEKTKAIVLVSPNNPTGQIYSPETLDQFFELAKQCNIPLVVDETYRDFMDDSDPPHGLFQKPDWQSHFIHLYSFSKAFSLTGHRVGAVVAGPAFLQHMLKVQDCVAISAPHIGQLAAHYGLTNLQWWRKAKGETMVQRSIAIREAFTHADLQYKLICAGAYFAYVKHPFNEPSLDVAKRLAEEFKIICLPGIFFWTGSG